MRFKSSRGSSEEVSFREAVFIGLAPDGGLFVPVSQPDLSTWLDSLDRPSFVALAEKLTWRLFSQEMDRRQAGRIVRQAFPFIPRLKPLEDDLWLLELFHGPTGAFKDFGASFLAAVMEEFLREEGRQALILVATSGDTGSAVAQAFYRRQNIRVAILYPKGRVSPLQEQQLTTLGGNVTALAVQGSFDDCQQLVKQAFMDRDLKSSLKLTSANSINLGRLLPQAYYYIFAYFQIRSRLQELYGPGGEDPERLFFCVPSGNFGNLTAGVYAWQWGLPVAGFLAATNANDVVPEYLDSGTFRPRASQATLSNAMDVGNPSNFERLLAAFHGELSGIRRMIRGERVTDRETREAMAAVYRRYGQLVDPHTAVGLKALEKRRRADPEGGRATVVLATAHPGKFSETVTSATGVHPVLPAALREALRQRQQAIPLGTDFQGFSSFLRRHYG